MTLNLTNSSKICFGAVMFFGFAYLIENLCGNLCENISFFCDFSIASSIAVCVSKMLLVHV